LTAKREAIKKSIRDTATEQQRLRENLQSVETDDALHQRFLKKLATTEDHLESLAKQIVAAREAENQSRQALDDFAANLAVEEFVQKNDSFGGCGQGRPEQIRFLYSVTAHHHQRLDPTGTNERSVLASPRMVYARFAVHRTSNSESVHDLKSVEELAATMSAVRGTRLPEVLPQNDPRQVSLRPIPTNSLSDDAAG
jgi:hypothetical protein